MLDNHSLLMIQLITVRLHISANIQILTDFEAHGVNPGILACITWAILCLEGMNDAEPGDDSVPD